MDLERAQQQTKHTGAHAHQAYLARPQYQQQQRRYNNPTPPPPPSAAAALACRPRSAIVQPRRRSCLSLERTYRVRQHLELPTDSHLRGAIAQDPWSAFPGSLNSVAHYRIIIRFFPPLPPPPPPDKNRKNKSTRISIFFQIPSPHTPRPSVVSRPEDVLIVRGGDPEAAV